MKKNIMMFLMLEILMFIIFVGLITEIFDMHRLSFAIEIVFLVVAALMALISLVLVYNNARLGCILLSVILAFVIANLLAIYYKSRSIDAVLFITAVSSALAFIISVAGISKKRARCASEPAAEDAAESEPVKKYYEPGKFVASSISLYYHAPKCDWAKKISKHRQRWFNSEEEAKRAGLKPHSCLK